jgi:hypothetical protein
MAIWYRNGLLLIKTGVPERTGGRGSGDDVTFVVARAL